MAATTKVDNPRINEIEQEGTQDGVSHVVCMESEKTTDVVTNSSMAMDMHDHVQMAVPDQNTEVSKQVNEIFIGNIRLRQETERGD
ncbi:UNVERIFIED_CONTAM: hypothetical protein Slati_3135900 [Sesamum latifolium]|uniref:Uncharacterized protein n=1 Tax=Sesamum latifolium TaxID=2727402 RepID=A0AAW2UW37_9LAMI